MTSQTAQSAPFSRFTRGGFTFPSRQDIKKKPAEEDDGYIPYNGPYEPPRQSTRRAKSRDSWGDALDEFDDGGVLGDRELHMRYGGDFQSHQSNGRYVQEERKGGSRDRAFSVHSVRTTSSGAMDPGRGSLTMNRRSTVSAANPPPLPSFVNLNTMGGGVGESPMPQLRNTKDNHRISIASIFSFGGSNRKSVASLTPERTKTTKHNQPLRSYTEFQEKEKASRKPDSPSSLGSNPDGQQKTGAKQGKNKRLRDQVKAQNERMTPIITRDDAYYNTYYQSVAHHTDQNHTRLSPTYQSRSPTASSHSGNSSIPQQEDGGRAQNQSAITGRHPYANAFPSLTIPPLPQTAPPSSTPHPTFNTGNPPRLMFTTAVPSSAVAGPSKFPPGGTGLGGLKNSVSTPNLRSPVASSSSRSPSAENGNAHPAAAVTAPKFVFPRGKERWLSAETWCDALLFPRPRLRAKQEIKSIEAQKQAGMTGTSAVRIVSPPTTPTEQREFERQQQREPGIASRVLAHSRSLVDLSLNKGKKKEKEEVPQRSILRDPQPSKPTGQTLRPPRPKSFALDDLALPSPVPSLAHVLREGVMLDTERKAWQQQAQGSFGNKHSRTMSRTRSKSLTQKGHKKGHNHQTSMEFIAAQACLGTQNYSPAIAPPRLSYFTDGTSATTSRGTHSHSNSLVKTLSKSTKTHSRNHSRNDSWSKSAMKMVTKPLAALSATEAPPQNKGGDLEGALKSQGTKVIRLADPVYLPLDRGTATYHVTGTGGQILQNVQRQTPSPAFSNISDSRVGIALGTPPEEESANYIPSHPYAQGGLSFNTAAAPPPADFAGPHRSQNTHATKVPAISDILARHKLPPHITLHPYAQTSNRDSYLAMNSLVGQYRSDDRTDHESKMWAQLSPSQGVVHEVLPGDLQYSPFSPEGSSRSPNRNTMNIRDTVGLGEALVSAVNASRFRRASPDSGLGTSESHGQNQRDTQQYQQNDSRSWEQLVDRNNLGGYQLSSQQGDMFASGSRVENSDEGPSAGSFLHPSNHTSTSSNRNYLPVPSPDHPVRYPSPSDTSGSYSPHQSSHIIGSPNDLESFHDLFFRPSLNSSQRTPNEAALPDSPSLRLRTSIPWDVSMRTRRTDSSLTNLARQLSDELEQMGLEQEIPNHHAGSMTSSLQQPSIVRRPTEGSLQFLFEEVSMSVSPPDDQMDDTIQAFKPTGRLPEDVLSSRASSFIEGTAEDDDPTAVFRVGMVESVSTPPAVSTEHRLSYSGQTALANDTYRRGLASPDSHDSHARILSGLQAPLTDITRSSYTSASTLSRMSNLSDFPVPPKDPNHPTPKHMSLLSSYFDEAISHSDSRPTPLPPAPALLEEDRVTFGGNQSADDLAKTLSSPNPEPF